MALHTCIVMAPEEMLDTRIDPLSLVLHDKVVTTDFVFLHKTENTS